MYVCTVAYYVTFIFENKVLSGLEGWGMVVVVDAIQLGIFSCRNLYLKRLCERARTHNNVLLYFNPKQPDFISFDKTNSLTESFCCKDNESFNWKIPPDDCLWLFYGDESFCEHFSEHSPYRNDPNRIAFCLSVDDNSWGYLLIEINYSSEGSFQINERAFITAWEKVSWCCLQITHCCVRFRRANIFRWASRKQKKEALHWNPSYDIAQHPPSEHMNYR